MKISVRKPFAPVKVATGRIQLLFSNEKKKKLYFSLKSILGFSPVNLSFYELSFIHKSASQTVSNGKQVNNERLEFLGDAILDAVISDYLYDKFPAENEGFLTQMRSKIVNGPNLSQISRSLGLNRFVTANIEDKDQSTRILEDAFEAFIGAIYMDRGYRACAVFIFKLVHYNYINIEYLRSSEQNYKSQLIEWGQKHKKEINFETDSFNNKGKEEFISYVYVDQDKYASGKGISKKEAEQNAAKNTMHKLPKNNDYREYL